MKENKNHHNAAGRFCCACIFIFLNIQFVFAQHDSLVIKGKVLNASGSKPLQDVSVHLKGTKTFTYTNSNGLFIIKTNGLPQDLEISFTGYATKVISISSASSFPYIVKLEETSNQLTDVVVSTGYQNISKERATGSFSRVDSTLLNRVVSTDILNRLDGASTSILFDRRKGDAALSIRGRSTLFGNSQPLIVLDNIPYEGDINNINPNDIESITLLKDAAAASIWGVRAGNGVIVITTKKGKFNQPLQVQFNSSLTIGAKPNIGYIPYMSSADFIDVEKMLFSNGYYDYSISDTFSYPVLSPVVEILNKERNGTISSADADAQINALKRHDVRNDYKKYLYQPLVNQQYSLNIRGGSSNHNFYLSVGYDKNINNLSAQYNRFTTQLEDNITLLKNLEISTAVNITQSNTISEKQDYNFIYSAYNKSIYPYAQLADENGNALAIPKDYRDEFKTIAEQKGLLNWDYKPLEDYKFNSNTNKLQDVLVSVGAKYKIITGLSAELRYQYEQSQSENKYLQGAESYVVRNLVNIYTQVNADGSINRPLPAGGILDRSAYNLQSQTIRAQLNYSKGSGKNNITALAGYEAREIQTNDNSYRTYGYDDNILTSLPVNYKEFYNLYNDPYSSQTIPYTTDFNEQLGRNLSYYANAAYNYDSKYTLSVSGRKDGSNLFGVQTNNRFVPLWSAGLAWNINKEKFYHADWLPYLKARITYGFNGNVDNSISAYTILSYLGNDYYTNAIYAAIHTPPNPFLKWERVKIINAGIDFGTKNEIFTGTIDAYIKDGLDLIGDALIDPTAGYTSNAYTYSYRGNTASTSGKGIDVELHTKNFSKTFQWNTTLLFSYNNSKVTHYNAINQDPANYITEGYAIVPLEGKPLYSVFTYKWAGLDPLNGDPQGFVDGKLSKDYGTILYESKLSDLQYIGPALPTIYGNLRNDFSWKNLTLSVNISYKLGYYFMKQSINYGALFYSWRNNNDYEKRWQQPGDEKHTNVPSLVYPNVFGRDQFYNNSAALAEKGDNIRLQYISAAYDLDKKQWKKMPLQHIQFYLYANNLGILWRANKEGLDPDYLSILPAPQTIAFGLRTNF